MANGRYRRLIGFVEDLDLVPGVEFREGFFDGFFGGPSSRDVFGSELPVLFSMREDAVDKGRVLHCLRDAGDGDDVGADADDHKFASWRSSAMSTSLISSSVTCLMLASSMIRQNGQPRATVFAPVARSSSARRFPGR